MAVQVKNNVQYIKKPNYLHNVATDLRLGWS